MAIAATLDRNNPNHQRPEHRSGGDMNWEQVRGNWEQMKGELKVQWSKLTDDDVARIDGERDKLVGRLQELYGITKEEAEKQIDEQEWKG
jgi:uncharacterized protein YjbJ (UPF0337 family)